MTVSALFLTMLETESYKCPGCAAAMVYKPNLGSMVCGYCGRSQSLPEASTQLRETFEQGICLSEYARNPSANLTVLSNTAMAIDCQGCGADLIFEPPDGVKQCPFCSRQILTLPRPADPALPPMGLLPFKINRQQARQCLQRLKPPQSYIDGEGYNKNIFLSKKPFRILREAELTGVYLPFWIYDGEIRINYTSKMICFPSSKTSKPFLKRISGAVKKSLLSQRVCATRATKVGGGAEIFLTFSLDSLKPYHPRYLEGFKVYRYQLNALDGFEKVKENIGIKSIAIDALRRQAHEENPYSIVSEDSALTVSTGYEQVRFRHVLLPVWIINSSVQSVDEPLFIDGQTGALWNTQIPAVYSRCKVALGCAFLFIGGVLMLPSLALVLLGERDFAFFAAVGSMIALPLGILLAQVFDDCRNPSSSAVIDKNFWLF